MSLRRRRLLQVLSYAFGTGFILAKNKFAVAAQNPARPLSLPSSQQAGPAAPAKVDVKDESGETKMEKVAGIGGVFFRAHDPKALGNWYQQHLGVSLTPTSEGGTVWQQEAGPTAFTPFPGDDEIFRGRAEDVDDQLSRA